MIKTQMKKLIRWLKSKMHDFIYSGGCVIGLGCNGCSYCDVPTEGNEKEK